MSNAKIDAAANSMKAKMNTERRKQESLHGEMLCCGYGNTCGNVAASGSCYCDDCEAEQFAEDCSYREVNPTTVDFRKWQQR